MLRFARRRMTYWVVLNITGIAAYLYFSSFLWDLSAEEGVNNLGNAFTWMFTVAPVVLSFIALNAATLYLIVKGDKARRGSAVIAWVVIAAFWLVAVEYSDHRTYSAVDVKGTS